jgi:hypothetical protein
VKGGSGLPARETARLARTVAAADQAAAQGARGWGHTLLLIGLQRAQALKAEHCSWSEELVERYEQACHDYVESDRSA